MTPELVIPAKAGIQCARLRRAAGEPWIPAFAGMTQNKGRAA